MRWQCVRNAFAYKFDALAMLPIPIPYPIPTPRALRRRHLQATNIRAREGPVAAGLPPMTPPAI